MSLRDTRDIGTAKIVMLGGGGGGSYTAGNGINITNNTIINTRKGALTGVIDSVSSNIAHTQIDNALTTTTAGALVVLKAEAIGTSIDTVRVQYGSQASESSDFRLRDTDGNYTTIDIAIGDTVIMMLNATGYQMIVLSILGAITGGGYAGLGIGKKKTVTNNIIDTDIDLHRAPMVGDRLLVYFDEKVTNPTGLTTYNNGTAVTSGLENVTPMYINAGWNILEYKDNLLVTGWVRVQNVNTPTTLSGLSDTLINSPSDGQMLVYENNMWKNKLAVQANPTGTAVRELKKIQIGDNVFDTFGLKTFDVTSVTSGVSGAISVDVITASQLNGEIIAIHTGSNTGSTGNAWTLALSDAQTVEALTMSKADGTAFTDALTANSLMFVKVNTSNDTAVVLGIVGAGSDVSGNGSGSPVAYLNKLKIGSAVYDTSAIRPFSVSQIANNTVKIFVADIDQLDGKVIALSTGALTGTTSSAWSLNLVDTSGGAASLDVAMLNADGTAFSDDISANELLFVAIDLTNYEGTILSVVGKSEDEIKTATGNPITLTDAIAGNAIEVSAEIVASQDLHGYDNPWVGGAGKNKSPIPSLSGYWAIANGAFVSDNTWAATQKFSVTPNTQYHVSATKQTRWLAIIAYDNNGNFISNIGESSESALHNVDYTFTTPSNCYSIGIDLAWQNGVVVVPSDYNDLMVEKGTTATAYEPYENICPITGFSSVTITDVDAESQTATVTVALDSTVYGGTLDLTSGELTVTHAVDTITVTGTIDSYTNITYGTLSKPSDSAEKGSYDWHDTITDKYKLYNDNWNWDDASKINEMFMRADSNNYWIGFAKGTTLANMQSAVGNLTVCYTLATPTTTTLTAEQLALVKGYNQLSCNSGDMEITYKASGLDALKERVDDLEDAVADLETDVASKAEKTTIGTVESGTTASQAYAVGEHFIRNDKFCTAIAAIASGATLTQGTNYVEGTIAEALKRTETYSTSEVEVGTWNGARLYRKMIPISALPNNASVAYPTGLTNVSYVKIEGSFYNANTGSAFGPIISSPTGQQYNMNTFFNNNNVIIETGMDRSGYSGYVVIYYTKNS